MSRRAHLRNAGIASFVVVLILLLVLVQVPILPVGAQALVQITPAIATANVAPGSSTVVTFTITNNTAFSRTFQATFGGIPSGFSVQQQSSVLIAASKYYLHRTHIR
jgi:hypothetical protein